jgi:hypothetical protein
MRDYRFKLLANLAEPRFHPAPALCACCKQAGVPLSCSRTAIALAFEAPTPPPGASLCMGPLNVPQIVREIPDQLTGAIHLAVDAAIGLY